MVLLGSLSLPFEAVKWAFGVVSVMAKHTYWRTLCLLRRSELQQIDQKTTKFQAARRAVTRSRRLPEAAPCVCVPCAQAAKRK